jgi:D-alanyl-D-alanine carboxypeptidase
MDLERSGDSCTPTCSDEQGDSVHTGRHSRAQGGDIVRSNRSVGAALALVTTLVFAACGSSDDGDSASSSTAKSTSTSGSSSKEPAYAATLQEQIPQLMEENAIPGAAVLIRSGEQGDWTSTFGTGTIGEDRPITLDDYWRIASNTKTMTAAVALQLVQEGKLALDDPLDKFVPGFPNGDVISVGQLLEMRSGLYSYTFDPTFNATLDDDPRRVYTPDELLAIARPQPAQFAPGTEFEYSNTNYVLLGLIIEQLTGKPIADVFEERIFEPLGLDDTSYPAADDPDIPQPHTQGYQYGTNVATLDTYALPPDQLPAALDGSLAPIESTILNHSAFFTAGAVISTLPDMADYVEALVGGKLHDERTQEILIGSIQPMAAGSQGGYGYGLIEFRPELFGHDGQTPGFSSVIAYDAERDITIVVATNLSASPVDGTNAAIVLTKAAVGALYASGDDAAGSDRSR